MGFRFSADEKLLGKAETAMFEAQGIVQTQNDINAARQFLTNIREYRLQTAAIQADAAAAEGVVASGTSTGMSYIAQQTAQPYIRGKADLERRVKVDELQKEANRYLKKYKSQAKDAKTTGIVMAVALAALGGFAGAALGAAAGGAAAAAGGATTGSLAATTATTVGATIGSSLGGAAGGMAASGIGAAFGADANFQQGVGIGTKWGTMIGSAGYSIYSSPATTVTSVKDVTASVGTKSITEVGTREVINATAYQGLTAQQWMGIGQIGYGLSGVAKEIKGIGNVKVPVTQNYQGNYSQYIQSFRGFY